MTSTALFRKPKLSVLMSRVFRVIAGILLALVVAEVGTRIVLPPNNWTPEEGLSSQSLQLAPGNLITNKPNLKTSTCVNLNPWTAFHTDSRGFRIPENAPPQNPQAEQLLILGASNTWGMGVLAEDSWPFVLGDLLAKEGHPVDILNAAQVGYTLPHMFQRAQQIADHIPVDRILIAVPSSGLYMFGLGSRADPWHFENFHPWKVTPLALEYPFLKIPPLEEVGGFVLRQDRWGRGGWFDQLTLQSAIAHRVWAKALARIKRFRVVHSEDEIDLENLKEQAKALGKEFCAMEDRLGPRGIPVHLVFFPAEWGDFELSDDATQKSILFAFQNVARVGLRRFPRADLRADPKYRLNLSDKPGADILIDGRHLSPRGHEKVAKALSRWYIDKGFLGK